MTGHFRLFLDTTSPTAPLIALLRRHTGKALGELRHAIAGRQPFLDETPHHNRYSAFISQVTGLLNDLEAQGIPYLVEVNGLPEGPQYLRNVFRQWRDLKVETRHMADLESGAPGIETLMWLKSESPVQVFQQTLEQIIAGDGYECDEETVAWARQELAAAKPGAAAGEDP
jgi:hypothetical protein